MKIKRLAFLVLSPLVLGNIFASRQPADTTAVTKNSDIKVQLTTTAVSDEELKKRRTIDGENPVQPLNIVMGPKKLTLWGYAHSHYTVQKKGDKTTNDMSVVRIILMARGELTKKVSFFIMYDARMSELHEYFGEYAFLPELKLRVGQFKTPYTLESILSPAILNNISFDNSALYMASIATDPCKGDHVGRDVGFMLTGDAITYKSWKLLNYSIGVFNGAGMNQKENNSQKDVIGMLNITPVKGLMFSTSFVLGTGHAEADNPYGAFKLGDNYKHDRWACGLEMTTSPLYARGELMTGNDGGIHSLGYYLNLEAHVLPKFDVVANYDCLKKNTNLKDSETRTYMAGVQYWFSKRCRVQTQYVHTHPEIGSNTNALITQFQMGF